MNILHKPLQTSFRANGFDYKQIKRVGDIAMFEQSKKGIEGTWFEVVIVQRHDGYTIAKVNVAPAESMPSASQWGKNGFTYRDMAAAEKRFAQLASTQVTA